MRFITMIGRIGTGIFPTARCIVCTNFAEVACPSRFTIANSLRKNILNGIWFTSLQTTVASAVIGCTLTSIGYIIYTMSTIETLIAGTIIRTEISLRCIQYNEKCKYNQFEHGSTIFRLFDGRFFNWLKKNQSKFVKLQPIRK
jgi:hypothetical protein